MERHYLRPFPGYRGIAPISRGRGNEIVFYFSGWDLHADYILVSFPSRLFQTTILLERCKKTTGKYENILDQGKSIVIFDDQRERERVLWRE